MVLFGAALVVFGDLLGFEGVGEMSSVAFGVRAMFELKSLINDVVISEIQELQHFLMMKEKLIAEISFRVGLQIFPFGHSWQINNKVQINGVH